IGDGENWYHIQIPAISNSDSQKFTVIHTDVTHNFLVSDLCFDSQSLFHFLTGQYSTSWKEKCRNHLQPDIGMKKPTGSSTNS
ncbi:hypothetical protein, partial [Klebsiella pneumoniae]|uniref:hypothetical protein n=1 Tax=Klebsiella pneumoniae TaxID=573 RepID=UPI00405560AE